MFHGSNWGRCLLVASIMLVGAFSARGQEDSSAALWQYYPPVKALEGVIGAAERVATFERNEDFPPDTANPSPVEKSEYAGRGSPHDPLFDTQTRPSWTPPRIVKPMIERPTYDYPSLDVPMYRLEQVQKVAIDRPAYVAPEANRPNYSIQYEQGPAEIAPTLAVPAYEGPNYVIRPYQPPAEKAPAVDRSGIDYHAEAYRGPVYQPEEYRPPRELPPEYMPPPRE
jgi:hypothetical protein